MPLTCLYSSNAYHESVYIFGSVYVLDLHLIDVIFFNCTLSCFVLLHNSSWDKYSLILSETAACEFKGV